MKLSKKSLEKLRNLINEQTTYRSGPKLVSFFKELGFNDSYGQGFPSRWAYTDSRLEHINGTPELDKCIRNVLAPVDFIGRLEELDKLIRDFNQYLAFDKWRIERLQHEIVFKRLERIEIDEPSEKPQVDEFLARELAQVDVSREYC